MKFSKSETLAMIKCDPKLFDLAVYLLEIKKNKYSTDEIDLICRKMERINL